MVIFGHRRGGLFLGKIFKFQGGSGPPVPPSGSAHGLIRDLYDWLFHDRDRTFYMFLLLFNVFE